MPKKTITCFSSSPGVVHPRYGTPWDDVWLRLKVHRKLVTLAPCVHGLADMRSQLDIAERVEANHQADPARPDGSHWWKSCISRLESGNESFLTMNEGPDKMPDILVAKEYLTRKDIEEVLRAYLWKRGYLHGEARFRWKKPGLFVASA